jgi:hypothetical protein
MKILK